ncbi:hypothetical protein BJ878DRAFT_336143 [Calycina marina]|uniref:Uncharacterized protein n=1 Tax=Calycina marina TaxID=1763456 RepID=A0A9P7YU20_9HELO|nr:hypothetical protein BJ878DRAFT_336143 [Calycina marina]
MHYSLAFGKIYDYSTNQENRRLWEESEESSDTIEERLEALTIDDSNASESRHGGMFDAPHAGPSQVYVDWQADRLCLINTHTLCPRDPDFDIDIVEDFISTCITNNLQRAACNLTRRVDKHNYEYNGLKYRLATIVSSFTLFVIQEPQRRTKYSERDYHSPKTRQPLRFLETDDPADGEKLNWTTSRDLYHVYNYLVNNYIAYLGGCLLPSMTKRMEDRHTWVEEQKNQAWEFGSKIELKWICSEL